MLAVLVGFAGLMIFVSWVLYTAPQVPKRSKVASAVLSETEKLVFISLSAIAGQEDVFIRQMALRYGRDPVAVEEAVRVFDEEIRDAGALWVESHQKDYDPFEYLAKARVIARKAEPGLRRLCRQLGEGTCPAGLFKDPRGLPVARSGGLPPLLA